MIKSKTNDNLLTYTLWLFWVFLSFLVFKAHIIAGFLLIAVTAYLYVKLTYKVILSDDRVKIKYLTKELEIDLDDITFVQISNVNPSLDLNLSIVTAKKNYNFGYGDLDTLILMLNYFNERKIKIRDERKLLNRCLSFDGKSFTRF